MPSQLWKIPLLLASARLYQQSTTPPNAPATASEKMKYGSTTPDLMSSIGARRIATATMILLWLYSLAESAVIVGHAHPTALTTKLLGLLVRKGHSAANVRITPAFLAGCALVCSGSALRVACYRELGRLFTYDLSIKADHRLITTGPYSVVRHPAYTGNCLIAVGLVLSMVSEGSWFTECGGLASPWTKAPALVWLVWHLIKPFLLGSRVTKEDRVLKAEFGAEWDQYAQRTPYRLFPFLY